MDQLKPIEQQVVVIMGASSGIGRLTALEFGINGARLVLSARDEDALQSLAREIQAQGGQAVVVPADVRDFQQVQAVAQKAVDVYGRLDTWVHLAAVSLYATFDDTTPQEFETILDTNLLGQIHGAKAALPHLRREGRGALIHVSSVEATRALPYQSAYAASKHGIKGFLGALRTELKHDNLPISVTNIMPASINTPLFEKARTKMGVKPRPFPPVYEPQIVSEAILHAAENPVRDMYCGGSGGMLATAQRIAPGLVDAALSRAGYRGQRTDEPKSMDAPDALEEPLPGHGQIYGRFGDEASSTSPYTELQTSDGLRLGLAAFALGAAAALAVRYLRNGDSRSVQRQRTGMRKEIQMAKSQKDWLVSWLNDAYAMEEALIPILDNHAKDAKDHPQAQNRIQQHKEQTRRHAEMIEQCLDRLDESPSSVKSGMGKVFGAMQSVSTGAAKDELVKNNLADFAAENFEIASYRALVEAARAFGDEEIARVCQQILEDEMAMADWLKDQLPQMVTMTMREKATT